MISYWYLLLQIQLMRTETEVTVEMDSFKAAQNLFIEPDGFVIKMFLSCSRTDTKAFKISGNPTRINQKLSIRNIMMKELEFWLCNTHNKIIASATLPISEQAERIIEFKMSNSSFAEVSAVISVTKKEIEKEVIVEADEQLLRKIEDPLVKLKKEEEEERKAKELASQLSAVKGEKKAAVTLTHFNIKDMPVL